MEKLERLYGLHYIFIYADESVEIPQETVQAYQGIDTPEFQKERKEVSWTHRCLLFVELLYGMAPERIVRRLLKGCLGYPVSRERFAELFEMIPESLNPCVRKDGELITREILEKITSGQSVGIFIGPEGGFEEEEVNLAVSGANAQVITLGKRILRTETAGLAVLSVLMFALEE